MTENLEAGGAGSEQGTAAAASAGDQEPSSLSEKYVASLWSEIIGVDEVLLPSKFIEVGGNSLTLNIILNRIEAEKGVVFDAGLFFEPSRSSLFEIARELDRLMKARPSPSK